MLLTSGMGPAQLDTVAYVGRAAQAAGWARAGASPADAAVSAAVHAAVSAAVSAAAVSAAARTMADSGVGCGCGCGHAGEMNAIGMRQPAGQAGERRRGQLIDRRSRCRFSALARAVQHSRPLLFLCPGRSSSSSSSIHHPPSLSLLPFPFPPCVVWTAARPPPRPRHDRKPGQRLLLRSRIQRRRWSIILARTAGATDDTHPPATIITATGRKHGSPRRPRTPRCSPARLAQGKALCRLC